MKNNDLSRKLCAYFANLEKNEPGEWTRAVALAEKWRQLLERGDASFEEQQLLLIEAEQPPTLGTAWEELRWAIREWAAQSSLKR
jgi:hypothetical protein